jgi:hypothetical protein
MDNNSAWYQRAAKLLESAFSGRPSLIVNGLHKENLLKMAANNNILADKDIDGNLNNRHKFSVFDAKSRTNIEVICSASGTYKESRLND